MVALGSVTGVFGVRGWLKVRSDTSPRGNILEYRHWSLWLEGGWQDFQVIRGRIQGKSVIVRLVGIDDRDQAAGLVGSEIAVTRSQLPAPKAGEFYWTDLEGLRVVDREGIGLGKVESLFSTGSNDVMVVTGERQRLIPFTEGAVLEVDLVNASITVDWDRDF